MIGPAGFDAHPTEGANAAPPQSKIDTLLSPREREIALRLAIGERNRDIADDLDISIKTVDTHRGHILKKLKLRHNVDLARLAIRDGLVPA